MGADREATSIWKELDLLWNSNGISDFYAKVIERSGQSVRGRGGRAESGYYLLLLF